MYIILACARALRRVRIVVLYIYIYIDAASAERENLPRAEESQRALTRLSRSAMIAARKSSSARHRDALCALASSMGFLRVKFHAAVLFHFADII